MKRAASAAADEIVRLPNFLLYWILSRNRLCSTANNTNGGLWLWKTVTTAVVSFERRLENVSHLRPAMDFYEIYADKEKLLIHTGMLNTQEDEVRLYRLMDVTLRRLLWERSVRPWHHPLLLGG